MAVYGAPDNFIPLHGNATGTLYLTYTIGSSAASFTYKGPGVGDPQQGAYPVTFALPLQAGVTETGVIAHIGDPPLHIPGDGGNYHSGTMTFTPPQGTSKGSLSGNFSSKALRDLGWAADSDTARPKHDTCDTDGEK